MPDCEKRKNRELLRVFAFIVLAAIFLCTLFFSKAHKEKQEETLITASFSGQEDGLNETVLIWMSDDRGGGITTFSFPPLRSSPK